MKMLARMSAIVCREWSRSCVRNIEFVSSIDSDEVVNIARMCRED